VDLIESTALNFLLTQTSKMKSNNVIVRKLLIYIIYRVIYIRILILPGLFPFKLIIRLEGMKYLRDFSGFYQHFFVLSHIPEARCARNESYPSLQHFRNALLVIVVAFLLSLQSWLITVSSR